MLGTILIISKRSRIRFVALMAAVSLVLGACADDSGEGEGVAVVATTSIAGDLVSQVVGDAGTVEVLMPIGADPHDFQPSSQQAASLRDADLVVAWGLGLEEGMADALAGAAADGVRVLELSPLVDPIPYAGGHDDHGEENQDDEEDHDDEDHDEEHSGLDAHTWMDPVRMADAVAAVGATLAEVAPNGNWIAAAEQTAEDLHALHEEIQSILAPIPAERRKLVTNHDSFGYFATRYDFEIVGVAIPGGSTLAAPSSAQLADLIETIRAAGVDVLFAETTSPASLLDAIAEEVEGVRVVELLEGSLAPAGEPGDTYAGMLIQNAETIAAALMP